MTKINKVVVVMFVLLMGVAFTLFAGGTKEGKAPAPKKEVAEPIEVGLSWNEKNDILIVAWEDYMVEYSKEYGEKIGREFKWTINVADGDPLRQNANIEDLITQRVDIIITRPQDKVAIGPAIKAAKEAGIPVVLFDRASETEKPNAFVGQDGVALAYDAASALAKLLKEKDVKGKAIELQGDLRDQNAVNFHEGWVKAEKEFGAWETLVSVPTEWKPEKYKSGLINALQANPEANVIWIPSDFAMDAVKSALEEAGRWIARDKPGHMWMASIGAMPAALPALEGGYLDVAGVWDAWFVSREAVEVIGSLAEGEKMDNEQFLVSGRPATPDNVNSLEHLWSIEYRDK